MKMPEVSRLMSAIHRGKKLSAEHRRKISQSSKGHKKPPRTSEWREKQSVIRKGKPIPWLLTPEVKEKSLSAVRSKLNNRWKGGISVGENKRQYFRFYEKQRCVRKRGNGGSHTLQQWEELKRRYFYLCLCCKRQEPFVALTEDHIVPLILGGSNDISNIQPLCRSCNSRKHASTIDYRTDLAILGTNQSKS